ncbi:MAG: ADP-ribosylglycohydrolase family protein [Clostridia bacterium]|nr:ADP-ribosylglycohydrolase family protein [Clostridia bacterium]
MKQTILKLCCFIMAATVLLTSCNNTPSETSASSSTESTSVTTDTKDTTGTTETTSTSDSQTTETTSDTQTTTTETTTKEEIPPVKPAEYTDFTITEEELYDKIMGGWLGQMIGVAWTASTEFGTRGTIRPASQFPTWKPEMISNAYEQDDVYVEVPFIDAMNENGAFCDPIYMGEKFTDSLFNLWHANAAARNNLRAGYSWYDAGHYLINDHADDLDWQIECDFLGSMYPGLVNEAAERAFEIGHMICYGDGVYGGVFVTAMHAAAYTADSIEDIVEAGIAVIPEGTKFRAVMDSVMKAYQDGKTWEEAWQIVEDLCGRTDKCIEYREGTFAQLSNIDAKLNASYIIIGLLWGEGDFAKTVEISCRCGQDSDCNPSSAASILGNFLGASGIEEIYKSAVNYDSKYFDSTQYTLNDIAELNLKLTKEVITAYGATESNGTWTAKENKSLTPVAFEQWADDFGADVIVKLLPEGAVQVVAGSTGTEKLKSVEIDMGDGFTMYTGGLYHYQKTGTYTLKYTFVSEEGTIVKGEKTIKIEAVPTGKGITSDGEQTLVFDGVIPYYGSSTCLHEQYELKPASEGADVWAGIQFDGKFAINGLKFVEGKHNKKGGWFTETPKVEVLIDGTWTAIATTINPVYPGNSVDEQGDPFQQYRFTFDEVVCEGIRIIGTAGGTDPYVSIGELTPRYNDVSVVTEFENADLPIVLTNQAGPTGSGSKTLAIVYDGVIDNKTYDTYDAKVIDDQEFFGYQFRETRKISQIVYTEGLHYTDGGWFKNGEIAVEILVNGEWKTVEASVSPAYPNGDSQASFGTSFETYMFTLKEATDCDGFRIVGKGGGNGDFIGINELSVQ